MGCAGFPDSKWERPPQGLCSPGSDFGKAGSVKKPSCGRALGGLGGAPSVSDSAAIFRLGLQQRHRVILCPCPWHSCCPVKSLISSSQALCLEVFKSHASFCRVAYSWFEVGVDPFFVPFLIFLRKLPSPCPPPIITSGPQEQATRAHLYQVSWQPHP